MKYINISLGVNFLTILVILVAVAAQFLPPVVPLLYGKPVGESQLVGTIWMILAPATALVLVLINFLLIKFSITDLFLIKLLNWASLLISVLAFITVIKIILLVGSF